VAVEAMSCGTPVVALRDGAIPEVVEDGVSGFVRDDVEGMAEAVKKLDSIRPEDCRALVERNFSREVMSKRYLSLYHKVLGGVEW
jgi:glycosyltransferase involved in cell wall biosynthesis